MASSVFDQKNAARTPIYSTYLKYGRDAALREIVEKFEITDPQEAQAKLQEIIAEKQSETQEAEHLLTEHPLEGHAHGGHSVTDRIIHDLHKKHKTEEKIQRQTGDTFEKQMLLGQEVAFTDYVSQHMAPGEFATKNFVKNPELLTQHLIDMQKQQNASLQQTIRERSATLQKKIDQLQTDREKANTAQRIGLYREINRLEKEKANTESELKKLSAVQATQEKDYQQKLQNGKLKTELDKKIAEIKKLPYEKQQKALAELYSQHQKHLTPYLSQQLKNVSNETLSLGLKRQIQTNKDSLVSLGSHYSSLSKDQQDFFAQSLLSLPKNHHGMTPLEQRQHMHEVFMGIQTSGKGNEANAAAQKMATSWRGDWQSVGREAKQILTKRQYQLTDEQAAFVKRIKNFSSLSSSEQTDLITSYNNLFSSKGGRRKTREILQLVAASGGQKSLREFAKKLPASSKPTRAERLIEHFAQGVTIPQAWRVGLSLKEADKRAQQQKTWQEELQRREAERKKIFTPKTTGTTLYSEAQLTPGLIAEMRRRAASGSMEERALATGFLSRNAHAINSLEASFRVKDLSGKTVNLTPELLKDMRWKALHGDGSAASFLQINKSAITTFDKLYNLDRQHGFISPTFRGSPITSNNDLPSLSGKHIDPKMLQISQLTPEMIKKLRFQALHGDGAAACFLQINKIAINQIERSAKSAQTQANTTEQTNKPPKETLEEFEQAAEGFVAGEIAEEIAAEQEEEDELMQTEEEFSKPTMPNIPTGSFIQNNPVSLAYQRLRNRARQLGKQAAKQLGKEVLKKVGVQVVQKLGAQAVTAIAAGTSEFWGPVVLAILGLVLLLACIFAVINLLNPANWFSGTKPLFTDNGAVISCDKKPPTHDMTELQAKFASEFHIQLNTNEDLTDQQTAKDFFAVYDVVCKFSLNFSLFAKSFDNSYNLTNNFISVVDNNDANDCSYRISNPRKLPDNELYKYSMPLIINVHNCSSEKISYMLLYTMAYTISYREEAQYLQTFQDKIIDADGLLPEYSCWNATKGPDQQHKCFAAAVAAFGSYPTYREINNGKPSYEGQTQNINFLDYPIAFPNYYTYILNLFQGKHLILPPPPLQSTNAVPITCPSGDPTTVAAAIAGLKNLGFNVTGPGITDLQYLDAIYDPLCVIEQSPQLTSLLHTSSQNPTITYDLQTDNSCGGFTSGINVTFHIKGCNPKLLGTFLVIHELGHVLENLNGGDTSGPCNSNTRICGPFRTQVFRNPATPGALPTWDCLYDYGYNPTGWENECYADGLAEYVYWSVYRMTSPPMPYDPNPFTTYPITWSTYYNFYKDNMFGGIEFGQSTAQSNNNLVKIAQQFVADVKAAGGACTDSAGPSHIGASDVNSCMGPPNPPGIAHPLVNGTKVDPATGLKTGSQWVFRNVSEQAPPLQPFQCMGFVQACTAEVNKEIGPKLVAECFNPNEDPNWCTGSSACNVGPAPGYTWVPSNSANTYLEPEDIPIWHSGCGGGHIAIVTSINCAGQKDPNGGCKIGETSGFWVSQGNGDGRGSVTNQYWTRTCGSPNGSSNNCFDIGADQFRGWMQ